MPIYQFELDTSLSAEEVANRIKPLVREPRGLIEPIWYRFPSNRDKQVKFIGKVDGLSFKLKRDIWYRNSFLPVIIGNITKAHGGSNIKVKMRIHLFVAIFMSVWFTGVGVATWKMVFSSGVAHNASNYIPLGMLVFGIVLVAAGFFPEALKARRILEETICT